MTETKPSSTKTSSSLSCGTHTLLETVALQSCQPPRLRDSTERIKMVRAQMEVAHAVP